MATTMNVKTGESKLLEVSGLTHVTGCLEWQSSDPAIATVTAVGGTKGRSANVQGLGVPGESCDITVRGVASIGASADTKGSLEGPIVGKTSVSIDGDPPATSVEIVDVAAAQALVVAEKHTAEKAAKAEKAEKAEHHRPGRGSH